MRVLLVPYPRMSKTIPGVTFAMPARDDSVIRGSLIACSIFLVLSLIANFLLWRWADTSDTTAKNANSSLTEAQATIQRQSNRINYLQGVIGVGELTQAELDNYAESGAGDANFDKVVADVATAMSYFGPEVDPSRKNLTALPEYLTTQIRTLSDQYNTAVEAQQQIKSQADADIKVARDAQKRAEDLQQQSEQEKLQLRAQFEEARKDMKLASEQLKDQLNQQAAAHLRERNTLNQKITDLSDERTDLLATVESQREELNRLRNSEFEVAQGEVTWTRPGDRLVMINLGAADQLRNGVKFEVYDADDTGVTDVDPKAMIEVVRISGAHLAEARLLGDSPASSPVIPGDKVYSPFWAPGREVRIAIAGSFDVNNDGKANQQDIDALTGVIQAAGAKVAAVVDPSGRRQGAKLDAGIRFLVVGQRAEASNGADPNQVANEQRAMAEMGAIIDEARQLGITVIPAAKLLGFLKTMDDSVTVPLGTRARGSDFGPLSNRPGPRAENDISDLYRNPPARDN